MARRRPEPSARRPSFEHRAHPGGQRLLLYTTRRRSRLLSSASWTVAGFFLRQRFKVTVGLSGAIRCPTAQGGGTARDGCVTRATAMLLVLSTLLAGAGVRHSRLYPDCCSDLLAQWRITRFLFCRRAACSALHLPQDGGASGFSGKNGSLCPPAQLWRSQFVRRCHRAARRSRLDRPP